MNDSVFTV